MFKRLAALALFASIAVAPAMAVTYDAAASFNGVSNPAGPFTFGQYDGTTFTAFTNFSTCQPGLSCLLSSTEAALGAYKNVTGAPLTAFTTVDVPTGALFLHPGQTLQAYVMFTSPTTAVYDISIFAGLLSNSTITGTTLGSGFIIGNVNISSGAQALTEAFPTYSVSGQILINAGDSIYLTLGNAGDYSYDSTQFGLTLTNAAVPEPAMWGLMIVGFGLVGVASRRRFSGTASRSKAALAA